MRLLAATCAIVMLATVPAHASDDTEALLGKALDELARNGSQDTSAAERYLEAILEQQPNHLEAQWQLLVIRLAPSKNVPFSDTAESLAAFSSGFARVAKLAGETKQEVFLHYMTAKHAGLYHDFGRALAEIDRAVALDPRSPRYLKTKGELLIESGRWKSSDAEIDQGIGILTQARDLFRKYPGPFGNDASYEFSVATAIMSMTRPRWGEVIEHYQRYLEAGPRGSVLYAFALNNISVAYRRAGDCTKAKESAEKALTVMKFGAAQSNKRYAEFCLEMKKSGLIAAR
jgi:tetratricopeptide (TPR) repeat protein